MELKLQVELNDDATIISGAEVGKIIITNKPKKPELLEGPVVVSFAKGKVVQIGQTGIKGAERVVQLFPEKLEPVHLREQLTRILEEAGVKTAGINDERIKIPTNLSKEIILEVKQLSVILERFGVMLVPEKKKPMKAQHRWNKAVSEVEFFVDNFGSKATIVWQKRNEMVIKKGATMVAEAPLNKDGSVGLNQRVGEKLRDEQKDKFKNLVTTEDIILKSVNEVSLFLYFAGTNSWLVFKDANGKTIDEYTVVK